MLRGKRGASDCAAGTVGNGTDVVGLHMRSGADM